MDVKNYLMQYRAMWDNAVRLLEERAEWMARAESATATIDGMPRGRVQHSDQVGSCAAAIADLDIRIAQTVGELVDQRNVLYALITRLPVMEQETIYRWCLLGQTFAEIADKMQRTERRVCSLYQQGLDLLQGMMGDKQ